MVVFSERKWFWLAPFGVDLDSHLAILNKRGKTGGKIFSNVSWQVRINSEVKSPDPNRCPGPPFFNPRFDLHFMLSPIPLFQPLIFVILEHVLVSTLFFLCDNLKLFP